MIVKIRDWNLFHGQTEKGEQPIRNSSSIACHNSFFLLGKYFLKKVSVYYCLVDFFHNLCISIEQHSIVVFILIDLTFTYRLVIMNKGLLQIDSSVTASKVTLVTDAIINAISNSVLKKGDILPSVNAINKEYGISRDTVFKAYSELKRLGVVESTRAKSYHVVNSSSRVFLFLDLYSPFKDALYNASHNIRSIVNAILLFLYGNLFFLKKKFILLLRIQLFYINFASA